jgi:hypothetical protein
MRLHLLVLAAALLCTPAFAAVPEPAGLSPQMRAGANEEPAFLLTGNGVHIYQCRVTANDATTNAAVNTFAWSFVAPDATLSDGARTTARLASPNLIESASDRGSVSGLVRASQQAGNNLPWTLMRAQPIGDAGLFTGVTSIQRVNTNGGMAPATGCNADSVGSEARVAYSADYYFYKRRGAS